MKFSPNRHQFKIRLATKVLLIKVIISINHYLRVLLQPHSQRLLILYLLVNSQSSIMFLVKILPPCQLQPCPLCHRMLTILTLNTQILFQNILLYPFQRCQLTQLRLSQLQSRSQLQICNQLQNRSQLQSCNQFQNRNQPRIFSQLRLPLLIQWRTLFKPLHQPLVLLSQIFCSLKPFYLRHRHQ